MNQSIKKTGGHELRKTLSGCYSGGTLTVVILPTQHNTMASSKAGDGAI